MFPGGESALYYFPESEGETKETTSKFSNRRIFKSAYIKPSQIKGLYLESTFFAHRNRPVSEP
jgi:hypothetical protein